jgi:hypothetical protein
MSNIAVLNLSRVSTSLIKVNPNGESLLRIKGSPVAVNLCYGNKHGKHAWKVLSTTNRLKIQGQYVVLAGDPATCGHSVTAGDPLISIL